MDACTDELTALSGAPVGLTSPANSWPRPGDLDEDGVRDFAFRMQPSSGDPRQIAVLLSGAPPS